jgi:hypothetical protein
MPYNQNSRFCDKKKIIVKQSILNKQIIHFGQDLDRKEFYNLIVKVSDINSTELSDDVKDELLQRGFMIYYEDEYTVKSRF